MRKRCRFENSHTDGCGRLYQEFIPHMAKEYGFQYELVQYKWPRWLHQQTEKQRIIWGYKILFLDVLFPLAVDKILFVDADQVRLILFIIKGLVETLSNPRPPPFQIVRTDLKELRDLDLEGAPYGYTPFCESRREMDGYRFWKSGYWASHLAGRKYHIRYTQLNTAQTHTHTHTHSTTLSICI